MVDADPINSGANFIDGNTTRNAYGGHKSVRRRRGGSNGGVFSNGKSNYGTSGRKKNERLIDLMSPGFTQTEEGKRMLKNCAECSQEEEMILYNKRADELTRNGPPKSTRSQTLALSTRSSTAAANTTNTPTSGQIKDTTIAFDLHSLPGEV